jgi:archaellum component FlaC|tara:strand:+ start:6142 stop:6396 length:255 start_codon:yes stop_codon:yes gene_type:complete
MSFTNNVLNIVNRENTYFQQDEMTDEQIAFSSSENSDKNEKPANKDINEGNRLIKLVQNELPGVNGSLDCVDEWVFITFRKDTP